MTSLDSALPAFDPMLQPIGYALASEFLGIDVLPAPSRYGSPVEWFSPAGPVADDVDEPELEMELELEIRQAS